MKGNILYRALVFSTWYQKFRRQKGTVLDKFFASENVRCFLPKAGKK